MRGKKLVRLLGVGLLLGLYACGAAEEEQASARVGELGKVKFTGGGGCNSSTTLAVGSKASLGLEAADGAGAVPTGLTASATGAALTAAMDKAGKRVEISAKTAGAGKVELLQGGAVYDRLGFSAEQATKVQLALGASKALVGGIHVVKLGEVYGACGTSDCPLIGGGFLSWTATPAAGATLVSDEERTVTFRAGKTKGTVTVKGALPAGGAAMAEQKVELLEAKQIATVGHEALVALPKKAGETESKILDPAPLPLDLPVGSLLMFRLAGKTAAGDKVPIWGGDITWTITSGAASLALYPLDGRDPPPEGPIFQTKAAGKATLEGKIALLGKSVKVDVTVK